MKQLLIGAALVTAATLAVVAAALAAPSGDDAGIKSRTVSEGRPRSRRRQPPRSVLGQGTTSSTRRRDERAGCQAARHRDGPVHTALENRGKAGHPVLYEHNLAGRWPDRLRRRRCRRGRRSIVAVIGGTGSYRGARGQAVETPVDDESSRWKGSPSERHRRLSAGLRAAQRRTSATQPCGLPDRERRRLDRVERRRNGDSPPRVAPVFQGRPHRPPLKPVRVAASRTVDTSPCVIGRRTAASPTNRRTSTPSHRRVPAVAAAARTAVTHALDELRPRWIVRVVRARPQTVPYAARLPCPARRVTRRIEELDGVRARVVALSWPCGSRRLGPLFAWTRRSPEPVAETALDRVVVHVPGACAARHRRAHNERQKAISHDTRRLVSSASS